MHTKVRTIEPLPLVGRGELLDGVVKQYNSFQ